MREYTSQEVRSWVKITQPPVTCEKNPLSSLLRESNRTGEWYRPSERPGARDVLPRCETAQKSGWRLRGV
jgi:hypothetical protein